MLKNSDFSPELKVVLTKMCEVIGVDPETVDFKNKQWYWSNTWTDKQQDDFGVWLANHVSSNLKARNELTSNPSRTKTKVGSKKFANGFIFNYGWKVDNG